MFQAIKVSLFLLGNSHQCLQNIYIHAYIYTYVHTCVHTHTHTHTHTHIHTYIHTCIFMYICTHTHTNISVWLDHHQAWKYSYDLLNTALIISILKVYV
jgi:hypothetical protein